MIWKCNVKDIHLEAISDYNGFWSDVLKAWCKLNYSRKDNLTDILDSIIWYNSDILVNNKPIFYKKCYEKGIVKIRDILNENNAFLSHNEICRKYGYTIDWVSYFGLIEAIPQDYKTIIRNGAYNDTVVTTFYENLIQKDLTSRILYFDLITRNDILIKTADRWEHRLQTPIDKDFMSKTFANIKLMTMSTKPRSFHFRLLQNIMFTNDKLKTWKVVQSDKCTFCNVEIETPLHILWYCQTAAHLWSQLSSWNRTLNLTLKRVIFCRITENPKDCVNTICLIAMQYIYSARYLKSLPNVACLKEKITDMMNIEKYIAVKNNQMAKFQKRWNGFIKNQAI